MIVSSVASLCLLQLRKAPEIHLGGVQDADLKSSLAQQVATGMKAVEKFFGKPYPKPFRVEVFPHRADLDKVMKERWKAPPSERWMVAAGVGDSLYILSPKVWNAEADEHRSEDTKGLQQLITHELVHVYHGQFAPKADFDGMDELGWFVEGLATYVSGQLEGRELSAKQALVKGKGPTNLAKAWSGPYRYGVSGSLVRYIDRTYGRKRVASLLTLGNTKAVLSQLGTNETKFLTSWRKFESQ